MAFFVSPAEKAKAPCTQEHHWQLVTSAVCTGTWLLQGSQLATSLPKAWAFQLKPECRVRPVILALVRYAASHNTAPPRLLPSRLDTLQLTLPIVALFARGYAENTGAHIRIWVNGNRGKNAVRTHENYDVTNILIR